MFDDAGWNAATVLCAGGEGDHAKFALRDIPFLTRERVEPIGVLAVEVVRPARYSWSLNPRGYLNPTNKTANFLRGKMLLMSHVYSDRAQSISFHPPHDRPRIPWKLNGKPLAFDDQSLQKTNTGVAHAKLRAGWNTLMGRLPDEEHYWWAVLNVWTKAPVRFAADPEGKDGGPPWLAIGPFGNPDDPTPAPPSSVHAVMVDAATIPRGATLSEMERIWTSGAIPAEAPYVRALARDMIAEVDVYAQCASERVVPAKGPLAEDISAMLRDTPEWTTVHPVRDASVRVLLDFGREVVGFHEFEVDAPAGAVIDNHNFEFIQPDGRINLAEGMNNSFRYVCRAGVQRYRTLLRRGFRYSWLSFRNFQRPIRVRCARVIMSTYPQARGGTFACSDPLLDRIWEVGAHSVRCCAEDTYTDCPTYEQTFWVGDARNEALVDLVVNGDPRLSAHSWRVAAQSLDRSPLVESQVPSAWQNLLPTWGFLWMRWAHEHFMLSGDLPFARDAIRELRRNTSGIEQYVGERGLIKIRAWNMFDWAAMDTPPDGEVTHLNCLAVLGLRQSAELARLVGAKSDARRWDGLADRLSRAINLHLWDDRRRAYIDCIRADGTRSPVFSQQTQTAAFIAGVPTGVRLMRCRDIMFKSPRGFVTAGSPFFMFFLLEGLVREGRVEWMVDTIRQYWDKQVEAGATTFWETYQPDQPRMTRSHCHGWSATPTYFLTQHLLGVQPAEPGYAVVRIAPQPAGLRWARGRVPTPRGTVECSWQHENGDFLIHAKLPPSVSVELVLPYRGRVEIKHGRLKSRRTQGVTPVLRLEGERIEIVTYGSTGRARNN